MDRVDGMIDEPSLYADCAVQTESSPLNIATAQWAMLPPVLANQRSRRLARATQTHIEVVADRCAKTRASSSGCPPSLSDLTVAASLAIPRARCCAGMPSTRRSSPWSNHL